MKFNNSINKHKIILLLLNLFLCLLFFFLSYDTTENAVNTLPNGNYYTCSSSGALDFKILSLAANSQDNLYINGLTITSSFVTSTVDPGKQKQVALIFTDQYYQKLHSIQIVDGIFFSAESPSLNTTDIVISTDLAFKLFGTLHDLIGRNIFLNSREMTIVGVYQTNHDLMSQLSSDGQDVVFTPYYSTAASSSLSVESIYVRAKSNSRKIDEVSEAELNDKLNGYLNFYQKTEYDIIKTLLYQKFYFTRFIAGILILIYLGVFLYRLTRKKFFQWKNTPKSSRAINGADIAKKSIGPLIIAVAMATMIRIIFFELYLPFELTPKNIVDIRFYFNYVIEKIQMVHRNNPSFYENYLYTATWIQIVFGILSIVFLLKSLRLSSCFFKQKIKL